MSMPPIERAEQALRQKMHDINAELVQWDGGLMKFWSYTVSYGTLIIRIGKPGTADNIHVRCLATSQIHGSTFGTGIRVRATMTMTDSEIVSRLVDEVGGLEVRCKMIDIFYNVAPLYEA
jgi:hypothetical protein